MNASNPPAGMLMRLGATLGLAQLAPLATSLALAATVARLGQAPFSAFMLVATINTTLFVAAAALLQALFIVGGRALGRDDADGYAAARAAASRLTLACAVACAAASLATGPALARLGVDHRLAADAGRIGIAAAWGVPAGLAMALLRIRAALAGDAARISLIYVAGGVTTFSLGLAAQHATGNAVAVACAVSAGAWLQLVTAMAIVGRGPQSHLPRPTPAAVAGAVRQLWGFGWPVALVVFLDSFALSASSVIVARFWPGEVAAHSTALLAVTAGLVLPLGVAQATLQLIAVASGRGEPGDAARLARAAVRLAAGFGAAVAAACAGAAALVPAGPVATLLVPAAALLAAQAVIVVAASALRSAGLVRAPLGYALVGYVGLAVGGALLFGPGLGLGLPGVWLGLVLGFGVTAAAVTRRALCHYPDPDAPTGAATTVFSHPTQQRGVS